MASITQIKLPSGDVYSLSAPATPVATTSSAGLMSATDKSTLDSLASTGSPINFVDTGDSVSITV